MDAVDTSMVRPEDERQICLLLRRLGQAEDKITDIVAFSLTMYRWWQWVPYSTPDRVKLLWHVDPPLCSGLTHR